MKTKTQYALLLVIMVLSASLAGQDMRPNIIYILADDLGYHELGCYGQKVIETPNIDNLAKNGIMFMNHYAGSNICAPSRCALLTGKHSGHGWIRNNKALPFEGNEPIPDSEITIAEILKKAGYTTGAFGKWGLGYPGSEGTPGNQGFDLFYGYNCQRHAHSYYTSYMRQNDDSVTLQGNLSQPYTDYTADVIHSRAIEFILSNKENPFFLYYATTIPHNPYHQPDDSLLEYYEKKTRMPKGDAATKDFSVPKHAALTARLDQHVGEVMDVLKELGLLENTLVIFTSDNGTALRPGENELLQTGGQLRGRKGGMYENGIKAPMIASWKGKISPGTSTDHTSAFWDVLPTFAEIVGIEPPGNIDGISFLPTLISNKDNQIEHEYLYWERKNSQAIRKGDLKAVITYNNNSNEPLVEIFNLIQDPFEKNNLADSLPHVKKEFIEFSKSARTASELFPLLQ